MVHVTFQQNMQIHCGYFFDKTLKMRGSYNDIHPASCWWHALKYPKTPFAWKIESLEQCVPSEYKWLLLSLGLPFIRNGKFLHERYILERIEKKQTNSQAFSTSVLWLLDI